MNSDSAIPGLDKLLINYKASSQVPFTHASLAAHHRQQLMCRRASTQFLQKLYRTGLVIVQVPTNHRMTTARDSLEKSVKVPYSALLWFHASIEFNEYLAKQAVGTAKSPIGFPIGRLVGGVMGLLRITNGSVFRREHF